MLRCLCSSISEYAVTNSRDSASFQLDPLTTGVADALGAGETDDRISNSISDMVVKRSSTSRVEEGLKLVNFRMYESPYVLIGLTIEK